MREKMNPAFEKLMKNKNTTDEIRMLCNAHEDFKTALETSLAAPIKERCFGRLSLKGVPFQVVDPANLDSHTVEHTYYFHVFKCSNADRKFHKPLRGEAPNPYKLLSPDVFYYLIERVKA